LVRLPQGAERHFGKFTLVVKLGWGGMADVYLANETGAGEGSGAVLVVKRLKPDLAFDGEYRAMFKDESKLALRFDHPNIVRAHEAGEIDGQPFLTMEFLNGQPLDKIFEAASERRLTRGEILHVVSELLSGMHYAHELKDEAGQPLDIVHRDVSPHNVFVTYEGRVKLVDFGIAKSRIKNNHTTTGVVKGKIAYMAPEQALASVVDKRADVFAAGVILWELMTGKPFWGDKSDVQILKTMTFGDLPSLDDALPNASPELRAICAKALSITPDGRYASAAEFREDIERFIDKVGERVTSAALGASIARLSADRRRALEHVIDQ
jgi:serine/threonine-protein kinase